MLLLICFFLSGFAALIYQTAWTRQLGFVFGSSELAVATVLAAYMGGLASGASLAARRVTRVRRPVLVFGLLELGIGLAALAVPAAIDAATALYVALFGGGGTPPEASELSRTLFTLGSSFSILLVPTALMGATLPLLARHVVRRESEIGSGVGRLYATNTAGAVAGAVTTGFILLPTLGLGQTVWVGVSANGLVFAGALLLARRAAPLAPGPPRATAARVGSEPGRWILPLVLVSGAVSFTYEVLWSRLLGHLLGGGVYGFATMVGSFLAGIALGSAAASRLASSPQRAARGFAWSQFGTAVLSLLAFAALDPLPRLFRAIAAGTGALPVADACAAAVVLLPAALCIGATFPFAVRVLARHGVDAGPQSARVLAWNTTGAIAGAIAAGFFLLPALGYAGVLTLGVVTNLALAFAAFQRDPGSRRRWSWVPALGLLVLALLRPQTPWELLRASPLGGPPAAGRLVHYGVGRSATVLLLERDGDGEWSLRANGLTESRVQARGAPPRAGSLDQWLGALPSLARPEARSLLMVGLGGGVVLEAVPSLVESIDVVELEAEVVRANRSIASRRRRDPLADPRVRLIVNDARGALLLTDKRYDAIVSQPSHPWTPGASDLFTREFFALARDRLAPSGVLAQWMGLAFVDEALLRTLVQTLVEVFPHVRVYRPTRGGLVFLASDEPLEVESNAARALAAAPDDFARIGVTAPEDVAAAIALDEPGARAFAAGAPPNRDDRNLLQMRSFSFARSQRRADRPARAFAFEDPLLRPTPGLDRAYLVRRLLSRGFVLRAERVAEASRDPGERRAASGLVALSTRRPLAARREFEGALELDPEALEARAALLRLRRRAEVAGGASETPAALGALGDPEAAVLEAWRAESESDWGAVQALEARLRAPGPPHPLFADAMRLRVEWRLAAGGARRAREAVALVDELIPVSADPGDLVLRARALAAAGDAAGAQQTLFETARLLRARVDRAVPRREIALEALQVLGTLPPGDERERLAGLLRQAGRTRAPGA